MTVYEASNIKPRRYRATKAEVEERREALIAIIEEMRPMTVRQVFYQATVRGLVEKAETGYSKVQTDLVLMRRSGELPYDWLADNTRWQSKPRSFTSVEQALQATAEFYRKALWTDANCYCEIWLEKDALAGVAEIHFERIAVTEKQIADRNLATRPTKASDTHPKPSGRFVSSLTPSSPDACAVTCKRPSRHTCRADNSTFSWLRKSPNASLFDAS